MIERSGNSFVGQDEVSRKKVTKPRKMKEKNRKLWRKLKNQRTFKL